MDNNIIVDSIKKLCKDKNITVSQLEKEIGLSQGLVSKWMNTTPSLDKIVDIANYFHVSIDEVVGYKQDDVFLNMLHDLTNNKKIKWFIINNDTTEKVAHIQRVFLYEYYDEEKYTEKSYFTKYKDGFIIIYAFHEYGKLINPNELSLYIQPSDDQKEYAWQDYSTNDLKSLWLDILSNMDNVPVEIKAEQLKTSFITEFKKAGNSNGNENIQKKKKILFVSNPHLFLTAVQQNLLKNPNGCTLYDLLNKKIIDQDENIGITKIGKEFYIKHKKTLGNIKQAKMFEGKILMLFSKNWVIKLSGFSSGSQYGNIGYEGLLYVLKDAGFDVSDQNKIDQENFIIEK